MSVKIRLQRFGSNKRAFYRVVATNSVSPRDGRFLEVIGTYNPLNGEVNIDSDKVNKWLSNGAQPTETVRDLLKKHNSKK